MFDISQFRDYIVKPALRSLILYSENAEELLVFTCAVETLGGTYLKRITGPALGIYQMEPNTYNDIWQNYINRKLELKLKLLYHFDAPKMPDEDRLIYDLRFATAMARIHYLRVSAELPPSDNPQLIWRYYKKYYNTYLGKAEESTSIDKYIKFLT